MDAADRHGVEDVTTAPERRPNRCGGAGAQVVRLIVWELGGVESRPSRRRRRRAGPSWPRRCQPDRPSGRVVHARGQTGRPATTRSGAPPLQQVATPIGQAWCTASSTCVERLASPAVRVGSRCHARRTGDRRRPPNTVIGQPPRIAMAWVASVWQTASTSGRSSRSTLIGTKRSLISAAVSGSSGTRGPSAWHPVARQVIPEIRTGRSVRRASSERLVIDGHQSTPGCRRADAGTGWSRPRAVRHGGNPTWWVGVCGDRRRIRGACGVERQARPRQLGMAKPADSSPPPPP